MKINKLKVNYKKNLLKQKKIIKIKLENNKDNMKS